MLVSNEYRHLSGLSYQVLEQNMNVSPLAVEITPSSLQQKGRQIGVSVAAHLYLPASAIVPMETGEGGRWFPSTPESFKLISSEQCKPSL